MLEEVAPDNSATPITVSRGDRAAHAEEAVRRFLGEPGWAERKRELKWLLALEPEWPPEPFVEILVAASKREWWRFWGQAPSTEQVAVALELLKHRSSDVVREAAEPFVEHADERIAAAARVLWERK